MSLGGAGATPRSRRPADPVAAGSLGSSKVALSGRGRSFVTVGLVSVLAGLLLGVTDLERVGILLLALPIPAWLVVRQARAGLTITHLVKPTHAEVGSPIEVKLSLGNPNAIGTGPLRMTESVPGGRPLRFSVAGIRARQRRTVSYPLPALGRGRYVVGPTTVVASDPFGLVLATSVSADSTEVVVRPRPEVLPTGRLPVAWRDGATSFSHSIGAGGSDDTSVREYRHGDDLRKIHWRSTARSGSIMVRQEERPWQGDTLLLLDTRASAYYVPAAGSPGSASEPFEWAVSAAASIGAHLVERRRRVTAVTGRGESAQDGAAAILDLLADAQLRQAQDLAPLAVAMKSMGRDCSIFALLAATGAQSMSDLLSARRVNGTSVAFLLDLSTWRAAPDQAWRAAPDQAWRANAVPKDETWRATAEALQSAGWRVVAVQAGDEIAQLWPSALGAQVAAR